MAITADKVVVELEARNAAYNANVLRSSANFERSMGRMRSNARLTETAVGGSFAGIVKGFATFQTLKLGVQLIDASTRITNSLKVAGLAGEELKGVYDSLYASAQRNAAPIESLAELYGRASLSAKELGVSQDQLLGFTDKVAVALRVSGKSAEESSGALLQLSQLLGSGTVRAEEFNSVQEGALPILQAVAAGMKEAGGSVAKLRSLVIQGKVSSAAFFAAFEAGSSVLTDKVAGAELTVSQQFTRLQNVLIDVAGKFNESTGAGAALGGALEDLGTDIQNFYGILEGIAGPAQEFIGWLQGMQKAVNDFALNMPRFDFFDKAGLDMATFSNNNNLGTSTSAAAGRVLKQNFEIIGATPGDQALIDAFKGRQAAVQKWMGGDVKEKLADAKDKPPITLKDYPVLGTGKGSKTKSPGQKFSDDLQKVEDMTFALDLETAAVGRGTYEKEKALKVEELLVQAREAGVPVTATLRAQIDEVSDAYARSVEVLEKTNTEQQRYMDGIEAFKSLASDALSGFVSDLRDGVDAAEALGNVFDKLADKLIDIAINNLIGAAFGALLGGGGGAAVTGIGKIVGGLFGARANGGPVSAGKSYIVGEKRPEVFVPNVSGTIRPNVGQSGGPTKIVLAVQEGAMFSTRVLQVSGPQSAEITRAGVGSYDAGLAKRTAEKDARYR